MWLNGQCRGSPFSRQLIDISRCSNFTIGKSSIFIKIIQYFPCLYFVPPVLIRCNFVSSNNEQNDEGPSKGVSPQALSGIIISCLVLLAIAGFCCYRARRITACQKCAIKGSAPACFTCCKKEDSSSDETHAPARPQQTLEYVDLSLSLQRPTTALPIEYATQGAAPALRPFFVYD